MDGPEIFAASISKTQIPDKFGNNWQYHPRSDSHSKVACWAIVFDLIRNCSLLREHIEIGKVSFGINHEMRDFRLNRKKNLDLVICTPASEEDSESDDFHSLKKAIGIELTASQEKSLSAIPHLPRRPVGSVLLALEAKACMTEHLKARPRLYDELSSSFQTILGDTTSAIAAGFVSINVSDSFVSPLRNSRRLNSSNTETTKHDQPRSAKKVVDKVSELPRRSGEDGFGFDALGVVMIECRNDKSPVTIANSEIYGVENILRYESLIHRLSTIYTSRFRKLTNS